MNTTECRSLKRKVDKSQHHGGGRSKIAKEASTEILTTSMHLVMLRDNDWTCLDSSPSPWEENTSAKISEREENEDGSISCGVMWKGSDTNQLESTLLQVCLDCKREANGKKFNCETQMFYCFPVTSTREVLIPEIGCQTATSKQATSTSRNLKNIKQEVQDQDCTSHPLVCCVRGCESRSDEVDPSVSFYTVPSDEEQKLLWTELFDIVPDYQRLSHHHVCSRHFMTPKQLPVTKTKTRKKKTCDMLLAEEAEKIKQGLAAGRPKRTPKPNKNYDWAELATFIKTEVDTPDEMDLIPVSKTSTRSLGLATRQRKQPFASVKKEDKENESPSPDADTSVFENADEYGENVSLPSHPRAPPPKPKGRPHRIRDICTQTDVLPSSSLKIPLREVKVQCNLTNEPLVSCPTCSIINWMRLEELLIDCLSKIERVFHDPLLSICLDKVLGNIEEPNHATNVLKLLSGMERDLLESPKDIILVSSQDEEVEIENVIHPEVEAPVTGVREITPKLWQAKVKLKTEDDDDEEVLKVDPDGLGLQEATELDDEEFQPDFPDADEDEDEEQELDDEEWSISRRDSDSGVSSKRKQKKMQLRHKKRAECYSGVSRSVLSVLSAGVRPRSAAGGSSVPW
ncbi:hypothetical protein OTU49_001692 [Cherax quadricarinatus]|uniref:THAP-type domain-containing protein n=1 Tax=Cherax quadricarinatus TaxID=27406 RepID=A0AAW0XE77_CHEQU